MRLESIINELGSADKKRPYYPFYAAIERGILNLEDEIAAAGDTPGVALAKGAIPNVKGAGLLPSSSEIAAFDHARIAIDGNELSIEPTSKDDVQNTGRILQEGAIIYGRSSGRLRIAAFAIDMVAHPEKIGVFTRAGFPFMNRVGNLAVISTGLMNIPEYQVTEVDADTGIVKAVSRQAAY